MEPDIQFGSTSAKIETYRNSEGAEKASAAISKARGADKQAQAVIQSVGGLIYLISSNIFRYSSIYLYVVDVFVYVSIYLCISSYVFVCLGIAVYLLVYVCVYWHHKSYQPLRRYTFPCSSL